LGVVRAAQFEGRRVDGDVAVERVCVESLAVRRDRGRAGALVELLGLGAGHGRPPGARGAWGAERPGANLAAPEVDAADDTFRGIDGEERVMTGTQRKRPKALPLGVEGARAGHVDALNGATVEGERVDEGAVSPVVQRIDGRVHGHGGVTLTVHELGCRGALLD